MRKVIDLTGRRFNRLTALVYVGDRKWRWRCDCGNEIVQLSGAVKNSNTKSCGCLNLDKLKARGKGYVNHPLYTLWNGIKARCLNSNHFAYARYGGRGITICERWMVFENFLTDMGARPKGSSVDRIDLNGHYEPSNCRWATNTEQQENTSRNQFIELDSERLTVSQWARKLGIFQRTLNRRRYLGWSDKDVLTKAVGEKS